MISLYFEELKKLIRNYDHLISSITLEEKIYSDGKGFVQGKVYFIDESGAFAEVKDMARPGKVKYRYHYMNKENSLMFRYDNAPHFPNLNSFPHHRPRRKFYPTLSQSWVIYYLR